MPRNSAHRMVERQIARRGVRDERVLAAMRKVEREAFLPEEVREFAYEDTPLPIEEGQTISQPYMVARMAEAAGIAPGDRVLEIGAGSGYAGAVLGELAARVYTIERHPALARLAERRLSALGYSNVEVRTGDGTLGWPEAQPFDAIIATAGGPRVPDGLARQLVIGGRLVMPVGDTPGRQNLVRVTRAGADRFDRETLEEVMFVPLIGAEGWDAESARNFRKPPPSEELVQPSSPALAPQSLPWLVGEAVRRLPPTDDPDFAVAFDRFADKRVVLLGEASHGTSEFYRARAAITRRLVERHGFDTVAVEADWPDALAIDRYVRHLPALSPPEGEEPRAAFRRFPTWMWRNTDVAEFVQWLRVRNAEVPAGQRAGFYGLDLYSLSDSIEAVLAYLDNVDPPAGRVARERYGCLTPWQHDSAVYGRAVLSQRYRQCEKEIVATLTDLLAKRLAYAAQGDEGGDERLFAAEQNARLVAAAERYYRIMYYGGAASWNLRDRHMFDTLARLLEHRGPRSKAVVWAHNSHIGDARFTDMGRVRDELNIGQLCRERFAGEAAMIGLGTHAGTVAAASDWGQPMQVMEVRPSRADSIERVFHDGEVGRGVLMLEGEDEVRHRLREERLERFIGVIYRPESELQSHYAAAGLNGQFEAYLWFDRTSAVTPLPVTPRPDQPDTWPFGV